MHKDVRVIMYNANVVIIKGRINPTDRQQGFLSLPPSKRFVYLWKQQNDSYYEVTQCLGTLNSILPTSND